ncbi:MAG: flagellar export protein FliJ [Peptococcaceae bacterium]
MGKFHFRLESLLNIVKHKEEETKKALADALRGLKQTQTELLELSQLQTQALRILVETQKGKISINELINGHQYCQLLKKEVENKQRELIKNERKVEEVRNNLKEINKKRKMLEKLKEKDFTTFMLDEEKNLQKELDEISGNLFFTSSVGGF